RRALGGLLHHDAAPPAGHLEVLQRDVGGVHVHEQPDRLVRGGDVADHAVGAAVDPQPARTVSGGRDVVDLGLLLPDHGDAVGVVATGGDGMDLADRALTGHGDAVAAVALGLDARQRRPDVALQEHAVGP